MHELSIAIAVVEAVDELARRHDADAVDEVRLRVGELAGVEPDALDFAFEVAREGTLLSTARFTVERVAAVVRCAPCAVEFHPGTPPNLLCPQCDGGSVEVLAGRELELAGVGFPAPDHHDEEVTADVPGR
ncbi:hydrogenase maturation nickel metallochaperone HypA [Streptomyces sannanensis]|uniref:Hydrogenase maturation factor HypA n=1 Tax=Streptomyces sannanensis TaxID=285536 RepID=A0ABP6SKI0_9ACTN